MSYKPFAQDLDFEEVSEARRIELKDAILARPVAQITPSQTTNSRAYEILRDLEKSPLPQKEERPGPSMLNKFGPYIIFGICATTMALMQYFGEKPKSEKRLPESTLVEKMKYD